MDPSSGRAAASGASARSEGARLHSGRDPGAEARRFLEDAGGERPSSILLLGPCRSYLVEAARARFPGVPVVSIQYDAFFKGIEVAEADRSWYPDSRLDPESFLLSVLGPEDVEGLCVLEWPPARRAFPDAARACSEGVRRALLSLNGAANALAAFGRAFLLNPVRNLISSPSRLALAERGSCPVVIAASGPSLEDAMPLLRSKRGGFYLAALSSALPALSNAGIIPDLGFTADSGFWAMAHLRPEWFPALPLAMGLDARVPPSRLSSSSVLFLESERPYERALVGDTIQRSGVPAPTSATVAAAALEACLRLSSGPIILAGLDLSSKDLLSHARPNAFDPGLFAATARLRPFATIAMDRESASRRSADGRRISPQFETYAAYMARASRREPRVLRYAPGAPPLRGLADSGAEDLGALIEGRHGAPPALERVTGTRAVTASPVDRARSVIAASMDAFGNDGPLDELSRDICSCICFSSVLKRRKALRSGDARLFGAAREEIAEKALKLDRRLRALGAFPRGDDR
jgi:hypothetical protein